MTSSRRRLTCFPIIRSPALSSGEAAGGGGNALLGFFLGILLLLAYLFLLVRTAEVYRAPEKYLGLPGKWLLTGETRRPDTELTLAEFIFRCRGYLLLDRNALIRILEDS